MNKNHNRNYLRIFILAFITTNAFAGSNFDIAPTPGRPFPTSVTPGATVSAFYTIRNNTSSTRSGYSVKGLPKSVSQNTTDPTNCAALVSLTAHSSCILQLDISGEAKSEFALCKGMSCTKSAVPLNVSQAATPQSTSLLVAAGNYNNVTASYPILSRSTNGGTTWNFVIDSTKPTLPLNYLNDASFNAVSCATNLCAAAGTYNNVATYLPLIASSSDKGLHWSYATPVLPPDFSSQGYLYGTSCSDQICVAVGQYHNGATVMPLLLQSTDNGLSWQYKTPVLPADFVGSSAFRSTSCTNQYCVSAGSYFNGTANYPLLNTSNDGGLTWALKIDSTSPASQPTGISDGSFASVSCNGALCIAAGVYTNGGSYPLAAFSNDSGQTWSFPVDSNNPAVPLGFTTGLFVAASCSGQTCIAAGQYSTGTVNPLLVATSDGGLTWNYSIDKNTPSLPADYNNSAYFKGANCSGQNCVAAGRYSTLTTYYPIVAASQDGGVSWAYTIDSSNPVLPADFSSAADFETASCAGQYCTAVGGYTNTGLSFNLLAASSSDGGQTWAYTIDATTTTLPPDYLNGGFSTSSATASIWSSWSNLTYLQYLAP